jgi:N-acetylmuramoyl-L-alanine amidase CwlA
MILFIKEKLLTPNEWSRPQRLMEGVKGIVLHWTADPGASDLNIYNYFEGRKLGECGYGSAHYVVGLDGEILHMIPDNEMAYHVGSKTYTEYALKKFGTYPNNCTLGIEMCVTDAEGSYPDETWESSVELCAQLCNRHRLDPFEDITTHQSIVGWKVCPKWFRDHPEDLALFKTEVSDILLKSIRNGSINTLGGLIC